MTVIVDNYDSFTYNLYQYVGSIQPDVQVFRNDKITVEELEAMGPERIILSPGPGFPADAGICIPVIRRLSGKVPILGVCLGHQAIGEAFGGKIVHAPVLMHGKSDRMMLDVNCPLFAGLGGETEGARYHSLMIEPETLPDCLKVTAHSGDGCIMAVQHRTYTVFGIQFHPESVLTPQGMTMIRNFLNIQGGKYHD